MKYLCNPLNVEYTYQFCKDHAGKISVNREAADPSMVLFKGVYYIFPSMTCGFWYSADMADWKFHALKNLPTYDYAPDVRPVGEWLYFCASNHTKTAHYRTKDPFSDQYEKIDGTFPFWDPNLFEDEDGRLYFYYGSSPSQPVCGVELDRETMKPVGAPVALFKNNEEVHGFERRGEDHVPSRSDSERKAMLAGILQQDMEPAKRQLAMDYILDRGYIEGAWMTKHRGVYYLQYGTPGAQFNIYNDGVYVSDKPLGPFTLARNNPFSYKPGGFLPGAGHGSTMTDKAGSTWHISTMRISVNHVFERRVGLWPAGWDPDGELFCNQRYGDWPYTLEQFRRDPWSDPEWMLLSYGKNAAASSEAKNCSAGNALDENVRTWWKAESARPGQWLRVDLGQPYDVRAVQVNFADDHPDIPLPEGAVCKGDIYDTRWIDEVHQPTRWILEGSLDGENWQILEDKSAVNTDLPHDLVVREAGLHLRYLRLTILSLPYGQRPCVSGLRVFGLGSGALPVQASHVQCKRSGALDLYLNWQGNGVGYVVNFGYAPDKLYHSYMTFDKKVHLGGLVKGQETYVRIDSFNESGITEGKVFKA